MKRFIVHARNAWLTGLSPKDNRNVPPLDYQIVYDIKKKRPDLEIILNGGLVNLEHGIENQGNLDGLMFGRKAYENPWILHGVDEIITGQPNLKTRHSTAMKFLPYVESQLDQGVKLHAMTRHMFGLFLGCFGARRWRQILTSIGHQPDASISLLIDALDAVGTQ